MKNLDIGSVAMDELCSIQRDSRSAFGGYATATVLASWL